MDIQNLKIIKSKFDFLKLCNFYWASLCGSVTTQKDKIHSHYFSRIILPSHRDLTIKKLAGGIFMGLKLNRDVKILEVDLV